MGSKGGTMKRRRRSFTEEFKAEAVALVLDRGVSMAQVAQDLDLTESALRNWVKAAKERRATGTEITPSEREELKRLRKEVRLLREERTILKKAAAYFAKENQ